MKLSLCIPTYNRGNTIAETIESILANTAGEVEIIVADNASTDDTEAVVRSFMTRTPHLHYFRWPENQGADRNFLKVIELASGDYCWLMGSDDKLEPGAIAKVLGALEQYPDLAGLSTNARVYSHDFSEERFADFPLPSGTVLYTSAEEAFSALGASFGYLSTQIVKRDVWQAQVAAAGAELPQYFNAYVHVYLIARMLVAQPRWLFLDEPCVAYRSGNDSFLQTLGLMKRLSLDVTGYARIASAIFGENSPTYHEVMQRVLHYHVKYRVGQARLLGADWRFSQEVFQLCYPVLGRYPAFWTTLVPLLVTPRAALPLLRALNRARKGRAARA